jgi:protein gp37
MARMSERTGIEWTDATWNPVTGCTKVSTGCDHCYAATLAEKRLRDVYLRQLPVVDTPETRDDPFAVRLWPERLEQPIRWAEPRMIFVNSMSDLFHVDVPDQYVLEVFEVMMMANWHVYQVLTKRPARAARFWANHHHEFQRGRIPEHIWIGASIENHEVEYRVRHLRKVPARIRFLSCEPLLGPITADLRGIHWVIVGGESGPGYRAMRMEWARGIRDLCMRSDVPLFFKQVGGHTPKAGGRMLDGREWDEMPWSRMDSFRRKAERGRSTRHRLAS